MSALLRSGVQWPHPQPEPHPWFEQEGRCCQAAQRHKPYPSSAPGLSPLAPMGLSANAPNKKQGLDLLLGTHTGGILLGLIFVVLFHADLDKGLRRRWGEEKVRQSLPVLSLMSKSPVDAWSPCTSYTLQCTQSRPTPALTHMQSCDLHSLWAGTAYTQIC